MNKIIEWDFRPLSAVTAAMQKSTTIPKRLKCVQWNIERGYHLEKIITLLKMQEADIISLQELDVGCERSCWTDQAKEIARALEMKCVFMTEFQELHSPLRSKRNQGGGLHGNAILSKYPFKHSVIGHQRHPVDWKNEGEGIGEPRRGERAILVGEFGSDSAGGEVFLVYNLHLEVFCGIVDRLKLFQDVLDHSIKAASKNIKRQLIMGDLNTGAHGIARLHYLFCRDGFRFTSWGQSEGSIWMKDLLSSPSECNWFWEAFPLKQKTLHSHHRLYEAKLDWILLRGWRVLWRGVDNLNYSSSDHRMLFVVIEPFGVEEGFFSNHDYYQCCYNVQSRNTTILVLCLLFLLFYTTLLITRSQVI